MLLHHLDSTYMYMLYKYFEVDLCHDTYLCVFATHSYFSSSGVLWVTIVASMPTFYYFEMVQNNKITTVTRD